MSSLISNFFSKVISTATLPYTLKEKLFSNEHFTVSSGVKKQDGSSVSVVQVQGQERLKQNLIKRLKSMRYHYILKHLDTVQLSETEVYLVCEPFKVLQFQLDGFSGDVEFVLYGIFCVCDALAFLNSKGIFYLRAADDGIAVTESLDWKLFSFEFTMDSATVSNDFSMKEEILGSLRRLHSSLSTDGDLAKVDAFLCGQWIKNVLRVTRCDNTLSSLSQLVDRTLLIQNASMRSTTSQSLGSLKELLGSNPYFQISSVLNELSIKEDQEKILFFKTLPGLLPNLRKEFKRHKVLPALINALEYGTAGFKVVSIILKLAQEVITEDDKHSKEEVVRIILKMFTNQDKSVRLMLLESLPMYIQFLSKDNVNELFVPYSAGFSDQIPQIREASLRAVPLLAPLIGDRLFNQDLLRHLARLHADPEASIRTNTTICLAKVSQHIQTSQRAKVLLTAFGNASRDGFPPGRQAALNAIISTIDCYCPSYILANQKSTSTESSSTMSSLLNSITGSKEGVTNGDELVKIAAIAASRCIDDENSVRELAFKLLDICTARLRKVAEFLTAVEKERALKEAEKNIGNMSVSQPSPSPNISSKPISPQSSVSYSAPIQPTVTSPPMASLKPAVNTNAISGSGNGWDDGWDSLGQSDHKAPAFNLSTSTNAAQNTNSLKLSSAAPVKINQDLINQLGGWDDFNTTQPAPAQTPATFTITSNAFNSQNDSQKNEIERKKEERKAKIEALKQQRRMNRNEDSLI
jgi:SCY1-like protein 1